MSDIYLFLILDTRYFINYQMYDITVIYNEIQHVWYHYIIIPNIRYFIIYIYIYIRYIDILDIIDILDTS